MTTPDTPANPETVTLIVAEPYAAAAAPSGGGQSAPDGFEEQALPGFLTKWRAKDKAVPFDKLETALGKAQDEAAALLRGLTHPNVPGFRLASVDIELSVSAEGSIGVATAGAEASITLSFEREP